MALEVVRIVATPGVKAKADVHGFMQERIMLEIFLNLEVCDILRNGCVCREFFEVVASPYLWFQAYCVIYRGRHVPPPGFQARAAGDARQLEQGEFSWQSMACQRARLTPSRPPKECLLGTWVFRCEMAPPERAGMVDMVYSEPTLNSIHGGTQTSMVWHEPLVPLPLARPIAYVEAYIHGGASVGLVDRVGYGNGKHVGWQPGSVGYFGDDGSLHFGNDVEGHPFGPPFGMEPVVDRFGPLPVPGRERVWQMEKDIHDAKGLADVIGVGVEFSGTGDADVTADGGLVRNSRTVFFTKNGAFVGSVQVHRDIQFFAFALHRLRDRASVNVGTCRFVFDIEAYSKEPLPADRYRLHWQSATQFQVA